LSRRFLTPVNLPHGSSLPASGLSGDLFFNTSDGKVYVHDGTSWGASGGSGGSIAELSDVTLTSVSAGDVLFRNAENTAWINTSLLGLLGDLGLISGDAGAYNTTTTTGTIDGGTPATTSYTNTYDGGNESSF
jgi:hypothetical protein